MAERAKQAIAGLRTQFEKLRAAREIIRAESKALDLLAESLGEPFLEVVEQLAQLDGLLIVTGMGKAGLIGQKLSATFASTGTPSHFLHPAEAIHGDLGKVTYRDRVLILSQSGETSEITRILPSLKQQSLGLIAMTANADSQLAKAADIALLIPQVREACVHGLAPSTSTASMLALGDALALVTSQVRGFSSEDFARYHPGGALGRKLSRVEDVMRPLDQCRVALAQGTVRETLVHVAKAGRRTGAIMLIDDQHRLCGIFTDSDLARMMEHRDEAKLDAPIHQVMTQRFHAIQNGARFEDALFVLASKKFSELPVVDEDDRPIGMIDITDVLGLVQNMSKSIDQTEQIRPASIRLFSATLGEV